jgi:hypothetical protein
MGGETTNIITGKSVYDRVIAGTHGYTISLAGEVK